MATMLKNNDVTIFCIGVGNVRQIGLIEIASSNCHYKAQNWEEIKEMFDHKWIKSQKYKTTYSTQTVQYNNKIETNIKKYEVVLAVTPPSQPIRIGKDLTLTVTIKNVGTLEIPSGTIIVFEGNGYFSKTVKTIPQIDFELSTKLDVMFEVVGNPTVEDIVEEILFKIYLPNGILIYSVHDAIKLPFNIFIGDMINWKPSIPNRFANILLFGEMGSGKTSYLNTTLSALSSRVTENGKVGGTTDHVTQTYDEWKLTRLSEYDLDVNIWDTYGTDSKNYTHKEFENMLDGYLESGFHMKDGENIEKFLAKNTKHEKEKREITALCLFIPQGAILESEAYVNKLADFAKRATNMNRMPLVLISRADEENQQDIREKMKEKIVKVTGISNDRIFFCG